MAGYGIGSVGGFWEYLEYVSYGEPGFGVAEVAVEFSALGGGLEVAVCGGVGECDGADDGTVGGGGWGGSDGQTR